MSRTQDQIKSEIKAIQQRYNQGKFNDETRIRAIDAALNGGDVTSWNDIARAQSAPESFGRGIVAGAIGVSPQSLLRTGLQIGGQRGAAQALAPISDINRTPFSSQYSNNRLTYGLGEFAGGTVAGAPYGALAGKAVKGAATVIRPAKPVQKVVSTPQELMKRNIRIGSNERYTVSDYLDYLTKRYKPGSAKETNQLIRDARAFGKKTGIDVTSGSPVDIQNRVSDFLDVYDQVHGRAPDVYSGIPIKF